MKPEKCILLHFYTGSLRVAICPNVTVHSYSSLFQTLLWHHIKISLYLFYFSLNIVRQAWFSSFSTKSRRDTPWKLQFCCDLCSFWQGTWPSQSLQIHWRLYRSAKCCHRDRVLPQRQPEWCSAQWRHSFELGLQVKKTFWKAKWYNLCYVLFRTRC